MAIGVGGLLLAPTHGPLCAGQALLHLPPQPPHRLAFLHRACMTARSHACEISFLGYA
jgi:hypothetical protein